MKGEYVSTMTDIPHEPANGPELPLPQARLKNEEEWMEEFQKGSTEAFSVLFDRYKQPVFAYFRRRLADHAAAEELTQETFLALLRARGRYQPQSLFRTYLYAIAFKVLSKYRRKLAFRATFFGIAEGRHEPGTNPTLETDLAIRQAVRKLDAMDREILLLRQFDMLSYAEIAEVLALPVNTVRSRLFRARAALRQLLDSAPKTNMASAPLHSQEQA